MSALMPFGYALVPLSALLRHPHLAPFSRVGELAWRFLPHTFFVYWLFSFIPLFGGLIYMLVVVPLVFWLNSPGPRHRTIIAATLLRWYVVILIGFGGLWSFIGHTLLAQQIAQGSAGPPTVRFRQNWPSPRWVWRLPGYWQSGSRTT